MVDGAGKTRTLYSLRHTYATQALLANRTDIHTLLLEIADVKKASVSAGFRHSCPVVKHDTYTIVPPKPMPSVATAVPNSRIEPLLAALNPKIFIYPPPVCISNARG